jgi:hypothetical protein
MAQIKTLDRISQKWSTVTPQRQTEYTDGVQNPRTDWLAATQAAAANYDKGIQAAVANKSFSKGVARAGSQKWQQKTLTKGPGRWAQGVSVSRSDYEAGFAKYHQAISGITLPPRGPKGDPSNINRVAIIAKTLHDLKVRGT